MTNHYSALIPKYNAENFILRPEINKVMDVVQKVKQGHMTESRVLAIKGIHGSGKTWFSLHLHRTELGENGQPLEQKVNEKSQVVSYLILLMPPPVEKAQGCESFMDPKEKTRTPEELLTNLLKKIAEDLEIATTGRLNLHERSESLVKQLQAKVLNRNTFVLIVDSFFEADESLRQLLERYLLAPIAALTRSLLVLTGRGRVPAFQSIEVRPRRDAIIALEPFNYEKQPFEPLIANAILRQIKEMRGTATLSLQSITAADKAWIARYSNGYPLLLRLLLLLVLDLQQLVLSERKQRMIKRVDEIIQLEFLHPNADQDRAVREGFEALSVLRGFREEEMLTLLQAYRALGDKKAPGAPEPLSTTVETIDIRALKDRLLKTALVEWQDGRYEIHQSVRPIFELYVRLQTPQLWQRLHTVAAALYAQWAKQYPQYQPDFEQLQDYHEEKLAQGVDADLPAVLTQKELK